MAVVDCLELCGAEVGVALHLGGTALGDAALVAEADGAGIVAQT